MATMAASRLKRAPIRSLALSVHFKQPDFGMKKHEILSRASAFLLAVDPFYDPKLDPNMTNDNNDASSKYDHLGKFDEKQAERDFKRNYNPEPAAGPPGREMQELGWLEFCPSNHRPIAHCVASSHVLAPWLWKDYYPQEWVKHVEPKHCAYSLDVMCASKPDQPLAKFALNPYPIHHPDGLDIALIHLKEEEQALKHMESLGVKLMHIRDPVKEPHFKGEQVTFEGFEIAETDLAQTSDDDFDDFDKEKQTMEEDDKVFFPYTTTGELLFSSPDRLLSSTPSPLPQGLCGGPVMDSQNRVTGIVEGVVPLTHEDKSIAGSAAFIPASQLTIFLESAERYMLEQIMPKQLFEKVVRLKEGKKYHDENENVNFADDDDAGADGESSANGNQARRGAPVAAEYDDFVKGMEEHYSPDQVQDIMSTISNERQDVFDILQREGGDVDEVIARVRETTRKNQYEQIQEAEIQVKEGSEDDGSSGKAQ